MMDGLQKWMCAGCAAFVLMVAVVVWDAMHIVKSVEGTARVIDKVYAPSSSGTGIGMSLNSDSGPVIVNNYTPEKYVILVSLNGTVRPFEVDADRWQSIQKNSTIEVVRMKGRIFDYGCSL
jgi:hypothetical protein